jgi:hypothetical protein
MKITFGNPYDYDEMQKNTDATAIDCTGDPGMTEQAPMDEQDINVIMKRFGVKDGSRIPYWPDPNAIYGDFSEMPNDPVDAAEYLRRGEVAFATLPATMRNQFGSGAKMYNWLIDPNNFDEAVSMGLLERRDPVVSSNTSSDKEPLVPPTPKES